MLAVAEDIGGRLVDRHRARSVLRVGNMARMQAQRIEFIVVAHLATST